MSTANGATADELRDLKEEQHQRQLEQTAHTAQLQEMFEGTEVEYLRQVIETDLSPGTIQVLDNYISPDFVLSKINEADVTEFKHQLRIKMYRVFDRHPPQGGVGGRARAYYYNDPSDALEPLSSSDRETIRTYVDGIHWRAKRSKDGFQQDKIGESTSRVETVNNESKENQSKRSGIRGFLG